MNMHISDEYAQTLDELSVVTRGSANTILAMNKGRECKLGI